MGHLKRETLLILKLTVQDEDDEGAPMLLVTVGKSMVHTQCH